MGFEGGDTGAGNASAGTLDFHAGAGIESENKATAERSKIIDAAERLMVLFAGNESAHGTHGEPEREGLKWSIKRTAKTLSGGATSALWGRHLGGASPLGVIPIRKDGSCRWGSIDIDVYDADLLPIIQKAEAAKLPLVPVRSKSGGLHLFLFLVEPQPAAVVQQALRALAARLGLQGPEIFPKQTTLDADRVGNWMVMPYYGDTFSGRLKEQVGLKKTGTAQTLHEFLDLAETRRVTPEALAKLSAGGRPRHEVLRISDMPPCLERIERDHVSEGRNNALFHYGVYAKLKNPDGWERDVEEFNQRALKPPLGSDEVTGTLRSLRKKAYAYTCTAEPMASLCERASCVSRLFGICAASRVHIDAMTILQMDPPQYRLEIDGGAVTVSAKELNNFRLFNQCAIEQMRRSFVPMKEAEWNILVDGALRGAKELDVPDDIREGAEFLELLESFLTDRTRGLRREDLLLGHPWEDDETQRHYFRLQDLQRHRKREGAVGMTRAEVGKQIRRLGGDSWTINVKGHATYCWFVPSTAVRHMPEVEPRPFPRAVL
jgi:hypothetical protein